MTHLTAVVAVDPPVLTQYGPLIAALIALAGALITLIVTGRRSRRESLQQREDDYRKDARAAVAATLMEARRFQRLGWVCSDPNYFTGLGLEGAKRLRDQTDDSMLALSQALIALRLLVFDAQLHKQLDDLLYMYDAAAEVVYEAADSFWQGRAPGPVWQQRGERFSNFKAACAGLESHAASALAPSVMASRAA